MLQDDTFILPIQNKEKSSSFPIFMQVREAALLEDLEQNSRFSFLPRVDFGAVLPTVDAPLGGEVLSG